MPFIKKLVLNNFKSFAREVEVPFTDGINVIVGPNGSGKSNITDAICFVLGRLNVKSMRAAKSANLIFVGSKNIKPAHEASVKLVFDNIDKGFPVEEREVSIERVVRRNGQSVYKINNDVKTRQEILELLSQAGVDPYGFNIMLQGGIQNIVKVHPEERRKIIEEVAGISIYESRKEKSIKELEKTEEKLKEVQAILRERSSYLKNLEQERKQALKFKELEKAVQTCKASIFYKKIQDRKKELEKVEEQISKKSSVKEKQKSKIEELQAEIVKLEKEISEINELIYKSGGIEQETLHNEITDLKAKLTGFEVRKENDDQKLSELLKRRERMEKEIKGLNTELNALREKNPVVSKKSKELEQKKKELEDIEKLKKEHYRIRNELEIIKVRINDKMNTLKSREGEHNSILSEIDELSANLTHHEFKSAKEYLDKLRNERGILTDTQDKISKEMLVLEKESSAFDSEINNLKKIKNQVSELDVCPLCKSKMTKEHVIEVFNDCDNNISKLSKKIDLSNKKIDEITKNIEENKKRLNELSDIIAVANTDIIKLENAERRKQRIKEIHEESERIKSEIKELENKRISTEKKFESLKGIEEKYDLFLQEVRELSSITEENIDAEIEFKERDLERTKIILKQSFRDEEELKKELSELNDWIKENSKVLKEKEKAEKELVTRFQKLIEKRNSIQSKISQQNNTLIDLRHGIEVVDNELNNVKIDKARISAEVENLEFDFKEYKDVEILNMSLEKLQERLEKSQTILNSITSVNLRALEVYESVKSEYDEVYKKVEQLMNEKTEIQRIIEEIDKKKKRAFFKTFNEINTLFSENFMRLSSKGQAYLELENKEDPFSGGLDIVIRIAKGKYFDVRSLSGGEQTLIALSLLFAVQRYRPYSFYIFDEIDAALDKRNSEKLAALISRSFENNEDSRQHIIITHNDALISSARVLYGVSMQDGISKLISIEL